MKKKLLKIALILTIAISGVGLSSKSFAQSTRIGIYRLWNTYTGKHLVASLGEANSLAPSGWQNEGLLGYLGGTGTTPVYRFNRSATGDHYLSTSSTPASGYVLEGILGYSALTGTAEFNVGVSIQYGITSYYRNSGGADHLYINKPSTESVPSYFTLEGIAFYVFALPS